MSLTMQGDWKADLFQDLCSKRQFEISPFEIVWQQKKQK